MSYRLHPGEPVEEGVRRVALDQIDRALGEIADPELGLHETVHQVRKRSKKLRGLLRLVRPALHGDTYQRENAALRDAQRLVSHLRDAQARIESFDALAQTFDDVLDAEAFGSVRDALAARRARPADGRDADGERRVARFRAALERTRERAARWSLDEQDFAAVRKGVVKTYHRGRRALRAAYAEGRSEDFHEWRKRVKYHGYQVRLLREAWGPEFKGRRKALSRLADLLGDEHDLAVLREHLRSHPLEGVDTDTVQALRGLAAAHRTRLRREALPLGRRLFAERPKALVRRLEVCFDVGWEEAEDDAPEAARAVAVAPPAPPAP